MDSAAAGVNEMRDIILETRSDRRFAEVDSDP